MILSLALALTLQQAADAPVLTEPPPPPSAETKDQDGFVQTSERNSFVNPERAKLEYELGQLKRDRPNLGFSVTMMISGTALFGAGLLLEVLATNSFIFGTLALIALIAGPVIVGVGLVTLIIGANKIHGIDEKIASKQAELNGLEARPPPPGITSPQPL